VNKVDANGMTKIKLTFLLHRSPQLQKLGIYKFWPGEVVIDEKSDQAKETIKRTISSMLNKYILTSPSKNTGFIGTLSIYTTERLEGDVEENFKTFVQEELDMTMEDLDVEEEWRFALPLERCRDIFYSASQAWYRRFKVIQATSVFPITPGLFAGDYSVHGVEIIQLEMPGDGIIKGVKVTGDPNVPFDKITFKVDNPKKCLDIPRETQERCNLLLDFSNNPTLVDYQEGMRLEFLVPDDCRARLDEKTKDFLREQNTCQGRWACECQVAGTSYDNPEMIPGNFIVFNNNVFGVIFLDLHTLSLYNRIREL